MKKYYVEAESIDYLYTIVEAQNEDEAYEIAKDTDGSDFIRVEGWGIGDWNILSTSIREITNDKIGNKTNIQG